MTKQHSSAAHARAGVSDRHGGSASANQDESGPARRTALERLLRVDVDATATRGGAASHGPAIAREDNQQALDDYADVSLELLALLSPHGTTQQWEEDDANDNKTAYEKIEDDHIDHPKRLSVLARVDMTEYAGAKKNQHHEPPDLTSPTQHMMPFQASPTHSAHGNELDLASPVALPESPHTQAMWEKVEEDPQPESYDPDNASIMEALGAAEAAGTTSGARSILSPNPSARARRTAQPTGRSPSRPHARTPGKSHASMETKTRARHGGIYSLLLKNKPPEHEPMLVDEKRSPLGPEVSPRAHSVSKRVSPPSIAKLQHGGIYSLLRRDSKSSSA